MKGCPHFRVGAIIRERFLGFFSSLCFITFKKCTHFYTNWKQKECLNGLKYHRLEINMMDILKYNFKTFSPCGFTYIFSKAIFYRLLCNIIISYLVTYIFDVKYVSSY